MSVFEAHDIVENRVQGRVEVVKESRNMEEILVDCPEELAMLAVNIDKTLSMKRSPAEEKSQNHSRKKCQYASLIAVILKSLKAVLI